MSGQFLSIKIIVLEVLASLIVKFDGPYVSCVVGVELANVEDQ